MKESGNIFARLARYVIAHPRQTIVITLLMCIFALLSASQLKVDPNIVKLLPPEEPSTKALLRINESEGGTHFLNISLRGGETDTRRAAVADIAEQIEKRTKIDYVLHDLSSLSHEQKTLLGLMHIPTRDLAQLDIRLKQALSLGPSMLNPMIASQLFSLGKLSERIPKPSNHTEQELCISQLKDSSSTCGVLSQIIVRPQGSPFDNDFAIPFMKEIYLILEEAELQDKQIEVAWIGGAYRHNVEDVEVVIYDVSRTAGLSLLLVLLFITIIYREKRALLIIFVPLLVGNIWTWGYTYWIIGELNTFTSFSSAILLGLGVDFAIHLYSRYQEEKQKFAHKKDALIHTWKRVGPPCAAAALTSSGGFIALRFGNFLGFQQLGIILAGGILLCLISVLVLLPLMIMWRESLDKPIFVEKIDESIQPQGIAYRFSGGLLAVLIIASVLCIPLLKEIRIDYDLSNLRKKGESYSEYSEEDRALADANFPPVLIEFETAEELYRAHKTMEQMQQKEHALLVIGNTDEKNDGVVPAEWDGLHIIIESSDIISDAAEISKTVYWLDARGSRRRDGTHVYDKDFIVGDFSAIAPKAIVVVDISQVSDEKTLRDTLNGVLLDTERGSLISFDALQLAAVDTKTIKSARVKNSFPANGAAGKLSVTQVKAEPYINGILSVYSLLPYNQEEKLKYIQSLVQASKDSNFQYLPQKIRENLETIKPVSPAIITKEDLPLMVRQLLGGNNSHRLLVFPKGNMWDVKENNKMAIALSKYLKDTTLLGLEGQTLPPKINHPLDNGDVVGEYIARSALFRQVKDDAPRIGVLAFLMIFVLSFLDVRSLGRSVSASLVLLMGLSFAGASFLAANISISMISFVGVPILMGIGIDMIIHLLHRISEEGRGRINIALRTTGKAAVFSVLTTIFSFLSLMIASNRGIQSLGLMTILGLFVITLCAFLVVPLGWMVVWTYFDKGRKPE